MRKTSRIPRSPPRRSWDGRREQTPEMLEQCPEITLRRAGPWTDAANTLKKYTSKMAGAFVEEVSRTGRQHRLNFCRVWSNSAKSEPNLTKLGQLWFSSGQRLVEICPDLADPLCF